MGDLLVALIRRAELPALRLALAIAGRSGSCDQRALLASLWDQAGGSTYGALLDVTDERGRPVDAFNRWLWLATPAYLRLIANAQAVRAIDRLTPLDVPRGELVVDDQLADLPLLALARDLAHSAPDRLARVVVDDLGDGLAGLYKRERATIWLDVARSRGQVARIFAHELAHALDPDLGVPLAEPFADALADLLLEDEPSTVAAADSLIDRATQMIGRDRAVDDVGPLVEFVDAPLYVPHLALVVLAALAERDPVPATASPTSSQGEGLPAPAEGERQHRRRALTPVTASGRQSAVAASLEGEA